MNKRKYAQLSLSLAAMLMAVPVWAAEQNNSAADLPEKGQRRQVYLLYAQ